MDMTYAIRVPAAVGDPSSPSFGCSAHGKLSIGFDEPLILDLVVLKPAAK
jgi:hypothetical protein